MPGVFPPVLLESAFFKRSAGVPHHVRITAYHHLGVVGSQRNPCLCFQPSVTERVRDARFDRKIRVLAADEGHKLELAGMLFLDTSDLLLVAQFLGDADGVDEYDVRKPLPRLVGLEDRQEWADRRPGGKQPEVFRLGHLGQAKKSGGARREVDVIAALQHDQALGERAVGHSVEIEFQRPFLGSVDEGIRAGDHLPVYLQRQFSKLPRLERRDRRVDLQRIEPLGPESLVNDAPFNPRLLVYHA